MLSFVEFLTEKINFKRGRDQDYTVHPNSVLFFKFSLNKSPVDMCANFKSFAIISPTVPFPEPGAPNNTIYIIFSHLNKFNCSKLIFLNTKFEVGCVRLEV